MKISYLKTLHCSKKKHRLQQLFYYFTGIPEFLGSGRKSWMLGSGCWKLNHGLWALDAGPWTLKLMRGSQRMGLLFKFGQAVPGIFTFQSSKRGFLWSRVKGVAPKTELLMVFCSPLGINAHKFVKNQPIFKNKGLFFTKFCLVLQEIFFMLQ